MAWWRRVLPAYAGMIPGYTVGMEDDNRAPRVCGDDPSLVASHTNGTTCSPRMRG